MQVFRLIAATSFAALLAAVTPAQGTASFRTFEHARTGLRFRYPGDFKPLPVQPTEKLVIGRFRRAKPYRARSHDRRYPEELFVFALSRRNDAGGNGGVDTPVRTQEDAIERRNTITSYTDFLKSRFRGWRTAPFKSRRKPKGFDEFRLTGRVPRRAGYVLVRQAGPWTVGVVGFADEPVYARFARLFRVTGRSIEEPSAHERVDDVDASIYAGKDYRDVPFRIAARRRMVKGWTPYDTENFFVVSHTKNKALVKRVADDLEAMRPVYARYFPPVKPIEAVSVVRVCRDRKEYHAYGGPPGSAGYWNSAAKELVLYDFTNVPRSERGGGSKSRAVKDSFIVLYHEGFHQYIYYAAGQIAPHMWFNEGLGDFFSGTVIYRNSRRVKGVGLNRWRIPIVKAALARDRFIPLAELLHAERAQYYDRRRVSVMYAEGWAFCYFLLEADASKGHQEWRQIIPTYFAALKKAYAGFSKLLGDSSTMADKARIEKQARDAALAKALQGVKLPALEKAWKAWIAKVEDPWRRSR